MPRVIGIDPGTVSIDVCGLDDGRVFLDRTLPTTEALADPQVLVGMLEEAGALDLVAGPSGYGLPLVNARDLTDDDLRLAYLIADGESGGIGGLRSLMRALARSPVPVVLTPGVIHLPTVPDYRKVNRVDMGTADKLCAVVLAVHAQTTRRGCAPEDVSFVLLELGGAFSAAIAVEGGAVVDGAGGTSGPLGVRSAGALDGEVAYLASPIAKDLMFAGGAESMGGAMGWRAYVDSAVKAVVAMAVSVPAPAEIVLSGRMARNPAVRERLIAGLRALLPAPAIHELTGFSATVKQAAQGAALMADGLAGGRSAPIVDALRIRDAHGTALDHLHVITPGAARKRLGLGGT
jgi:predicted butyrate kinase (DUF1464 family)